MYELIVCFSKTFCEYRRHVNETYSEYMFFFTDTCSEFVGHRFYR